MQDIHSLKTKPQRRAEIASSCIGEIKNDNEDYARLAKKFPALVHTCGLVQATAFVLAKEKSKEKDKDPGKKNGPTTGEIYLKHLARVMEYPDNTNLHEESRKAPLLDYQHMTQDSIDCAAWLKRYAEAVFEDV